MLILKQSTAVDVLIGPFVDKTDAATAETGESPSVKLSKNGQALAAKTDVTTPVSDADGYYNCELDATDTDTVGTMALTVAASATALPVRHEFQVVEEAVYVAMYAAGAPGPLTAAAVNAECDTAISDAALATAAALSTAQADLDIITGASGVNLLTTTQASIDAIETDTSTTLETHLTDIKGGTFAGATDSLEAIRDRGDAAWVTGAGGSSPTVEQIADGVWDELMAGHVTADSAGLGMNDWQDGGRLDLIQDIIAADVVNMDGAAMRGTDGVDTATMRGTDSAALASVATEARLAELDAANLPSGVDAILVDTGTTLPALLPSALSAGGNMKADALAVNGNTTAAANLALAALGIVPGACEGIPTTTVIQTDLSEATDDHYIGALLVMTSGNAAGERTPITDYTGSSGTLTVTAMTTAPASGDTFVIV